ncbi:MAG: hypothetical protein U5N10_05275 [Gemmobacter sp.]|nr:hypothetical protein [Gemmobacter sp.]
MDGPYTIKYGIALPSQYLPLNVNKRGLDCNDNDYTLRELGLAYRDADGDYVIKDKTLVNACLSTSRYKNVEPGFILKSEYDELCLSTK